MPGAIRAPTYAELVNPRFYLGGGIGSGKSAAGEVFAALGAVVLSGDDAGREVLAPGTEAMAAVLRRWPEVGRAADPRAALGRIVFADPVELTALEEITAPGIRSLLAAQADAHPDAVVLVEVPVLRDVVGREWLWIVVDAPGDVRLARALQRDPGRTEAEVLDIMSRQPSRSDWLAAADWVVDNRADRAALEEQCRRVWEAITAP